ncbi:hypothetical protein SAMN05216559_1168 [Halomicrobium zhouii]|uniref:Uncharacterized protein n=2 Tax=Halomicrobium zhouii TaxID=767519 RepID=A0A1I6KNU3_9EURY|nr:hypothetical protein SAMN05216559_1168 [Halomicrobium zhouii]
MRLMTESDGERRLRFRYNVLLTVLVLVAPVAMPLDVGAVDWFWVVSGAVLNGVAVGPFARTATADRINDLAGEPGSLRKVIAIVVMAVGIWSAIAVLQPSAVALGSFVVGGMAALLVVETGRKIRS